MSSCTLIVSPIANLQTSPIIIPCYHCQIVKFQIPITSQAQNSYLSDPNNPYLATHLKLESLHYEFHEPTFASSLKYSFNQKPSTTLSTSSEAFYSNLASIWVANLQLLNKFLLEPSKPDVTVASRRSAVTENLTPNSSQ